MDAAGVAAVEDHRQPRLIGQLGVEAVDLVVGDCVFRRPIEVPRHQHLDIAVGFEVLAVLRHLGPVAAVVEDQFVARLGVVHQPFQPLQDAVGGRAGVEAHPDGLGGEAAFLQHRAHCVDVVDAALQPVGGVGIVVDPDQQRLAARGPIGGSSLGLRAALGRRRAGDLLGNADEIAGADRQIADRPPDVLDRVDVLEIALGRVIAHARQVERRVGLAEVRRRPVLDRRGEDVVVAIVQMVPEPDRQRLYAPIGQVADDERIVDLRAEGHIGRLGQQRRDIRRGRVLVGEGVVGDQRAQAVGQDQVRLKRLIRSNTRARLFFLKLSSLTQATT